MSASRWLQETQNWACAGLITAVTLHILRSDEAFLRSLGPCNLLWPWDSSKHEATWELKLQNARTGFMVFLLCISVQPWEQPSPLARGWHTDTWPAGLGGQHLTHPQEQRGPAGWKLIAQLHDEASLAYRKHHPNHSTEPLWPQSPEQIDGALISHCVLRWFVTQERFTGGVKVMAWMG